MRLSLRWRLLLLGGLAPAALALGSSMMLSRVVGRQVRHDIDDSLARAARVIERQVIQRMVAQSVAARVIARDPSFYSAVALPHGAVDPSVRATVRGVAHTFQGLTEADVFEVWDRKGRVLASAGLAASSAADRTRLMAEAMHGREFTGLLGGRGGMWQVAMVPVRADGAFVGALLLGSATGPALAREMNVLTRAEVTFVAGDAITGSSLGHAEDAQRVLGRMPRGLALLHAEPVEVPGRSGTWVALARPLPGADAPATRWFVIQRSLDDELVFLRLAQQGLLLVALLAVLVTAAIGVFTAERITRPIVTLVRGAEAMERGDYDAPIDVRGHDEVAYLASRFRHMRTRERDYIVSLQEVARVKSEFITLASHQLRTPITVIKGYFDLFKDGMLGEMSAPQRHALAAMEDGLAGLIQLTEDATRVAQIEGERLILERGDHPLGTLVEQAIALARENADGRRLNFRREIPLQVPHVWVDGPRMVQALANLVRNGIRFTPDGGHVVVRVRHDADGCVLEVADTGVGMTDEQRRKLLSRSFVVRDLMHHHSSNRLDFGSAGLGLGLAITRGIVEAHGGTLALASEPDQGCVATIHLPPDACCQSGAPSTRRWDDRTDTTERRAA